MHSVLTKNQALLGQIFFTNPNKAFYIQEIAKMLQKKAGIFQRILYNFEREGILKSEYRANARYFMVNKQYPLYRELKNIVLKTVGAEEYLKVLVDKFKGIELAIIYGSYPKNKESASVKINLLLVGNIDRAEFAKCLNKLNAMLNRKIEYTLYSKEDMDNVIEKGNGVLKGMLSGSFISLKGGPEYLSKIVAAADREEETGNA